MSVQFNCQNFPHQSSLSYCPNSLNQFNRFLIFWFESYLSEFQPLYLFLNWPIYRSKLMKCIFLNVAHLKDTAITMSIVLTDCLQLIIIIICSKLNWSPSISMVWSRLAASDLSRICQVKVSAANRVAALLIDFSIMTPNSVVPRRSTPQLADLLYRPKKYTLIQVLIQPQ